MPLELDDDVLLVRLETADNRLNQLKRRHGDCAYRTKGTKFAREGVISFKRLQVGRHFDGRITDSTSSNRRRREVVVVVVVVLAVSSSSSSSSSCLLCKSGSCMQ